MNKSILVVILAVVGLTTRGVAASCEADKGDAAQLLLQMASALRMHEAENQHLRTTGRLTEYYEKHGGTYDRFVYDIKFERKYFKQVVRMRLLPGSTSIPGGIEELGYLDDGKFRYIVKRPKDTRNFFLRYRGPSREFFDMIFKRYVGNYTFCQFTIHGLPLADLLDSKTFDLRSATSVTLDGRNCVRFEFFWPGAGRSANDVLGWWVSDPEAGWIVREYGTESVAHRMTGRISYRRDAADRVVPSRVEANYVDKEDAADNGDPKGGLVHTYKFETDEYDRSESPDANFTLAPYNLAIREPDGRWAVTKRTVYIACGIVTLSLYLVFNRLHQMQRSRRAVEKCEAV